MQKIAMFSNVPMRRVFSMHDRESIYTIPEEMRQEGLDREILSVLNLHERVDVRVEDRARDKWNGFVKLLTAPRQRSISLAITGKYAGLRDAYASIDKAIEHCGSHLNTTVDIQWIDTTELNEHSAADVLQTCGAGGKPVDCVIVPGGFGKRGIEGKIAVARHCRERGVPYLGICLGFQVAVIEFARHVCGLADANSTEFDTKGDLTPYPVISELPDQKKIEGLGGTMRLGAQDVILKPGSLAAQMYGKTTVRERFRHRYEVDPQFVARLEAGGMVFSGKHPRQPIMQVMELPPETHSYFIGGQFHPELLSRPLRPHPLFMGLIAAALRNKYALAIENDPAVRKWLRATPAKAVAVG
jgi:CTP synthase